MKVLLSVFLLSVLLLSCGTGGENIGSAKSMNYEAVPEMVVADEMANPGRTPESRNLPRKLIRNGDVRFQTKNISSSGDFIIASVRKMGGYVSGDNVYDSEDRITRQLAIRIPADNFDRLIDTISGNERSLEFKNVQLQDVTEEFIDIEARLKTKKELEARYMQLLQKAQKVEEILSIEKELGTLRSDIESIEGRLKYLNDQVGFSTLNAEFYQLKGSATNFSSRLGSAFIGGWRWLINALVGLVHLWPFVIIIPSIIFVSVKISRKMQRRRLNRL